MARPFNNYGPGLKITDRRVIPDFARDVLAGRDIVMLSDGSPRRTFCYVADAVAGYYKALVRGRPGEPYNIGVDGPEISMVELAETIAGLGRALRLHGRGGPAASAEADYLVDNPNRRCPTSPRRGPSSATIRRWRWRGLRRTLVWYSTTAAGRSA